MQYYNIISPSIQGLLSDDYLYFEGINRPNRILLLSDNGKVRNDEIGILEEYFNDVYNLFLRKISVFASLNNTNAEDTTKLQALLQELIKVKRLILDSSESKHKDLI